MPIFFILLFVYAGFVAWASVSGFFKKRRKVKPEIDKAAQKSFYYIAGSGAAGLIALIVLNNDSKELSLNIFTDVSHIVWMSVAIASLIVFIHFWNDSPSHSFLKRYQVQDKNRIKFEEELAEAGFETTKKIEYKNDFGFFIDMNQKKIAIADYLYGSSFILPFSEILDCEITENNNASFAGESRVFQIVNSIKIRIITNDVTNALKTVELLRNEVSKDGFNYQAATDFAREVYSTIFCIIHEKSKPNGRAKK